MRNLPCLCDPNSWLQGDDIHGLPEDKLYDIVLMYGTFRGSDKNCGGLPYRIGKGKGQGRSTHPYVTRGWYLWDEIAAAQDAGLITEMEAERWIVHTRTCEHSSPYAFLADMYERRKAVGKNTPHGRALKLALNSMYGKSAQSIGEPKYSNPIYASMITSACRTGMLYAIATHPHGTDDLVMVATDGIYFRSPHPILDDNSSDDVLGGWEAGIKENLTVMKPGVYWDDKARHAPLGVFTVKSRGISAKTLHENLDVLDEAFSEVYASGELNNLPKLEMSAPFGFISPAQALARGKWETCGEVHRNVSRRDSANIWPKRHKPYIDGPYIRTECPPPLRKVDSEPYVKDFGFERALEESKDLDWITESGTLIETFNIALDVARAGE
jgi:hypothetical protein